MIRNDILRRFEEWLDTALAEEAPPPGIPDEILTGEQNGATGHSTTDLYAMWAAITTLTQEVKLQGRAFKQLGDTVSRETERRNRKEMLDTLLEIRDRLLRGLESARLREVPEPSFLDRIFHARRRQIEHFLEVVEALRDGYRLGLESLDDLLQQFQARPIECQGKKFDPRTMSAVDIEETSDVPEGTVTLVYRTGYEWNGEVYRPAKVRVAKPPRKAVNQ